MSLRRIDPIFGKPTPLLFAHRGGAKEVEESTLRGFHFAVEQTRAEVAGGAVHVFLTDFSPIAGAIDDRLGHSTREELFAVLDRGVEGIMTDRPKAVRTLIDEWVQQHPFP